MWALEDARQLVRDLNKMVRPFDFHVALGGGVINNGESRKDIDLYVLPVYIDGHKFTQAEWVALDRILGTALGPHAEDMRSYSTDSHEIGRCFRAERIYTLPGGKRIDLFIVDPQ